MQFIVTAHDGEGMYEKRMSIRPRHLENMKHIREHVLMAGGLTNEEGLLAGSALVMEYDSREQLDEYLANEPYVQEKVWETIEIEQINVVILDKELIGK